ncbi:MAG TPA: hypothetical protein VK454_00215, partial [Myxococcaceae bacterium]|nr:hypothetical protein [Myxococcaceae bacterium]
MQSRMAAALLLAVLSPVGVALAGGTVEYRVTNLASLGGTASAANSLNDLDWSAGFSNLPGDSTTHATLWLFGARFDLGTLGGDNSNVAWPVKNSRGVLSGIA